MQRTEIESGLLKSIGYDPEKQELEVEFKNHKEGQPMKVYRYTGVTPEMHAEFMAAESKGKFFLQRIKPDPKRYPYVRVEEEKPADAPKTDS